MAFHKYLGDSKMFEYDKHYRECQQQNRPFIKARVNPLHNNYFIQMDMMTCNYKLSKNDQGILEKLIRDEIEYVKSNSKYDFQGFSIDKELVWVDGVSSEHVDSFCISLYDLKNKN
ncbi:MAG: hypothetical protein KJO99_05255 [Nitrosopumilus sp.]|nr:hypothetical protein [Nitrosopumilus sp.]NNL53399.1 hypothetical protein [Nitrosopumilus sp.]